MLLSKNRLIILNIIDILINNYYYLFKTSQKIIQKSSKLLIIELYDCFLLYEKYFTVLVLVINEIIDNLWQINII